MSLNTGNSILSNAITVDSSYNVGIGQASPSYKLDVSGTGRFTGLLTGTNATFGNGTINAQIGTTAGYYTNSTTFTDLTSLNAVVNLARSNGLYTQSIFGYQNASGDQLGIVSNNDIKFIVNGDATKVVIFKNTGNVGIGTSSPSRLLHVAGTAQVDNGIYFNNASGSFLWEIGNNALRFGTNDTERMRITSAGNVGIGTTNPLANLHLLTASGNTTLYVQSTGTGSYALTSYSNVTTGYGYDVGFGGSTSIAPNSFYIYGGSTNSLKLVITSAGNTALSGGLTVGNATSQGSVVYFSGGVVSAGAGVFPLKWNNSTGIVTYDTSTRLVKENIEDNPYGLAEILQLKPRKYYRIDDEREEIGFVADEVIDIIPELVPLVKKSLFTKNDEDDELIAGGVYYEKLTSVLVKAIQEMNTKIDQQQQTINSLINR